MNPLTNMKNVQKLSERELYTTNKTSWHDQYRNSAWLFIGGLPYDLTEGDIICIFSQYGEIVNINLIRDKDTGKSKGFCFLCYEDQRSTDLAVDNFNGIKILGRIIRVDHVSEYKVPKQGKKTDEETKKLYDEGCAPKPQPIKLPTQIKPTMESFDYRETLSDQIKAEIKLPERLPIYPVKQEKVEVETETKEKKHKKKKKKRNKSENDSSDESKKKRNKKKKKRKQSSSSSSSDSSDSDNKKKKSSDSSETSQDKHNKKRKNEFTEHTESKEISKTLNETEEIPNEKRKKSDIKEPEFKRQENKYETSNYRYYDRNRTNSPGPYQRKKWYNY